MSVLGIIVEYNPFHNGHLYHLRESIARVSADYTVCAMSGNFVQRGEPAIVNKRARAKMALLAGADLIVEIPAVYAASSAEFFAYCGVKILDSLGIVDYICFGSEAGEIEQLEPIAEILYREPELYKAILKKYLDEGLSYPKARENALQEYMITCNPGKKDLFSGFDISGVMGFSNNILAVEYLKALKRLNSRIKPVTIKRKANLYTTQELTGEISSATAIRKHLRKDSSGNLVRIDESLRKTLPEKSVEILEEEFSNGRGPVFFENFESIILSAIRKMKAEDIRSFPNIAEGLENRIKNAANNSGSLEELIDNICTKRYTRTRIQRTLVSMLLGITAQDFITFNNGGGPQYIRVLGFNKKGAYLLSKIKKRASLPVIVKASDFIKSDNPLINRMLEIEFLATDIYVLGYENPAYRKSGQEYTDNLIIL